MKKILILGAALIFLLPYPAAAGIQDRKNRKQLERENEQLRQRLETLQQELQWLRNDIQERDSLRKAFDAMEKAEEAVRVRQRRRWERKHPDS
jgi:cell shape-determining protein MreC